LKSTPVNFVISEDPAIALPSGARLVFEPILPKFGPSIERAAALTNWHAFEGIVLAIVFADTENYWILGSAVLVAPGIALCASHVIETHVDEMLQSKVDAVCFGITSGGAQAWKIFKLHSIPGTDVSVLGLQCASALPPSRTFYRASITTRLPTIGERIVVAGFRASEKLFPRRGDGHEIFLGGSLTVCSGKVQERYSQGRDKLLAPSPCIEIDCPAWGGMSGGPVFDSRGFLVGLIRRSWETIDEPSPMLSTLLWPTLGHRFDGGWPMLFQQKSLLELNRAGVCFIDRPEAVSVSYPESSPQIVDTAYSAWS
jgi:Trypsin-like peptidase domain